MKHRTPEYWPTRILLAVGFVATVIALAFVLLTRGDAMTPMFDHRLRPVVLGLPLDLDLVVALVGLLPALLGLAWMLRIFRGPRDEPPAWRYRDR